MRSLLVLHTNPNLPVGSQTMCRLVTDNLKEWAKLNGNVDTYILTSTVASRLLANPDGTSRGRWVSWDNLGRVARRNLVVKSQGVIAFSHAR